jgi:hypothetical protein
MHNCVPNGTRKHENLDTIRHDNILNVTTRAHRLKALNLQKKLHGVETTIYHVQNLQVQTHFHPIEKPLHHPKSSV